MKSIRFIRHAESAANAGLPTNDPSSIPLTERGKQAAALAAEQYKGPEPNLIVVSPYLHAKQTAEPFITRFPNATVETWPVQEFTYISPARCVKTTAAERRPLVEKFWSFADPRHVDGEGAESFLDFTERVLATLGKLRARPEENILIVCHGIYMNATAFYRHSEENPHAPDSMRRFHQYTKKFPISNLEILEDFDPTETSAKCPEAGADGGCFDSEDDRASIDQLINKSLAYNTGDKIVELFEYIGRITVHSPYNAMLLHAQNPKAKMMLSAQNWAKLGRTVQPHARPYVILSTMGPVSFVFDETETEGEPLQVPEQGNLFNDAFAVSGELHEKAWKKLLNSCTKIGVVIEEEADRLFQAGLIQVEGILGKITINSSHSLETKFITLLHELAHLFCGHIGLYRGICHDRSYIPDAMKEVEAEATAYLVAKRRGLKSHSAGYISAHLRKKREVSYSMDAILVAAGRIEAMCKGKFRMRKQQMEGQPCTDFQI